MLSQLVSFLCSSDFLISVKAAHMWNNQIAQRAVSLVGMVVKIRAPNQSKADPKVSFFLHF